ncbi:MAG: CDP-diacylglycerol--glycerol-3-phosphate 3-phosphatidyltransferase [Pedosphaera sp.]|nr:CDP-diacylglycerol--glycerol-3-phosphate 3-phosphatidyltransferase [Pedosphaera sp.]MSU42617.1 CDP-diacylglycerol--glycerol-3-phosphate 3-phosphatidyltransferase [Pedosphaera sp.]
MNLPNKITTSRFFITVIFVVVMLWEFPHHYSVAAALFFLGGLSDIADGEIARRRNLKTDFGVLMDPLIDKIMVCAGFIMLIAAPTPPAMAQAIAALGLPHWLQIPGPTLLMPAWMVIIIVARELAITGLRLLAANNQVVLAAESIGKRKTNLQVTAVIAILICVSYPDWGAGARSFFDAKVGVLPWSLWFTLLVTWAAVALTMVSGIHYLWGNRALFLKDM